jgi:RhtB (resistance to homoserine/threonine) family protein
MQYLPEFLTVAILHLMAVISPGPDFLLITRNSLLYSRKTGIFTAAGLGLLGNSVHVIYSIIGIGYLVSQSVMLFSVVKLLGAGYLIYIGIKSIRSNPQNVQKLEAGEPSPDLSPFQAVKLGFFTNVLNPKATLFFFSIFSQVIDQNTPAYIKVIYGLEMSLATFLWFSFVALILSNERIRNRVSKLQNLVSKTMGALLIALGIKIAISRN